MIRFRFITESEDNRPIIFPPVGPYWCSGYGDGYSVMIAYANSEEEIFEYWPEAKNIEELDREGIKFCGRFPKPSWWKEESE